MAFYTSIPFWLLVAFHLVILLFLVRFGCFQAENPSEGIINKLHKSGTLSIQSIRVSSLNPKNNEKTPDREYKQSRNSLFWAYLHALKFYHSLNSIFFLRVDHKQKRYKILIFSVNTIATLGISGTAVESLNFSFIIQGIASGISSKLVASFWEFLFKQNKDPSKTKLKESEEGLSKVEKIGIERLKRHSEMRKVLGFVLLICYYAFAMYLCLDLIFIFEEEDQIVWMYAFCVAMAFELVVIESVRIVTQLWISIELSKGLSDDLERLLRSFLSEDFVKLFKEMEGSISDQARTLFEEAFSEILDLERSQDWKSLCNIEGIEGFKRKRGQLDLVKFCTSSCVSPEVLVNHINEPRNRISFNKMCIRAETVETVDQSLKVVYFQMNPPGIISKRDTVAINGVREENGKYYVIFKSIDYPRIGIPEKFVRMEIIVEGYVVSVLTDGRCEISLYACGDPKGKIPSFLKKKMQKRHGKDLVNILKALN